ncbi:MAG: hypothetical protein IT370_08140 [Deltaproteobacteria bacterium]|nr:hypothetical protein [Deltaproteobacteria bacterium]
MAGLRLANACACCLAPPTTSIPFQSAKVVWGGLQKTGTMRVPMCGDCTRDRTELIKWVSIVSFVLAGVLAFFVANALVPKARDPEQDQGMLRVLLMVGIAGAGGGLGRLLASRTKKSARPGHTALCRPIDPPTEPGGSVLVHNRAYAAMCSAASQQR